MLQGSKRERDWVSQPHVAYEYSARDDSLYHRGPSSPNLRLYFWAELIIRPISVYIGPATSRKMTVFGALRLLFPSTSHLLAMRKPAFGFPTEGN